MTEEIDIYRSANLLIKQMGYIEAEIHAAQRADELLEQGNMEGRMVWLKVLSAIQKLTNTQRASDDETVH